HAKIVVPLNIFQTFIDRVTTFESHQCGYFPLIRCAPDIIGSSCEHPCLGVFVCQHTNRLDLIVSTLHRSCATAAKQLGLNPDRKELRIQISRPCTHSVEVAIAELLLNIDV